MTQEIPSESSAKVEPARAAPRGRMILLAVALAAVIAGVVIALVSGSSPSSSTVSASAAASPDGSGGESSKQGRGTLAVASAYLGVSRAQLVAQVRAGSSLADVAASTPGRSQAGLVDALVAARSAAIDQEVSAGRVTAAKAKVRLARITARVMKIVNRVGLGSAAAGSASAEAAVASTYLGLSQARIRAERRSGKSLAQIAQSTPGRSSAGLIAALEEADKAKLESDVRRGTLSPAAEKSAAARVEARVTTQVNRARAPAG